jgi:hypothetical protein
MQQTDLSVARFPSWYPDSESVDGVQVMVLQPGEPREGSNSGYTGPLPSVSTEFSQISTEFSQIWVERDHPLLARRTPADKRQSGDGAMFVSPPWGNTESSGKFRECGLHLGVYRLSAFQSPGVTSDKIPIFFGESDVAILDKDIHDVAVTSRGPTSVAADAAWDGKPPADGGCVKAKVADKDGNAVPNCSLLESISQLPQPMRLTALQKVWALCWQRGLMPRKSSSRPVAQCRRV